MLEFIYKGFANSSERKSYAQKSLNIFFGITRKIILRFSDPLVNYKLWNYNVKLPLSHNLPAVLSINKNYNTNLPRVAGYINSKYKNISIVDIGANIGDTAALIRSFVDYPIMCVEGDKGYFELTKKNTEAMKDIVYVHTYLGENDEKMNASVQNERGTGIISFETNSTVTTQKLDTVLKQHPEFKNVKLLKIDTDGFDFKIMKGSTELLKTLHPVIFTEFDQNLMKQINEDYNDMFEFFRSHNYTKVIFYTNVGDYLISLDLNEKDKLEDITNYFDNRNTELFCDICVFHESDNDLFEETRKKEMEFFSENR